MNAKTAKKLRKIAVVYGVSFKDVEKSYKEQGDDFIRKYEERGGLNHYGQIKNEIRKSEVKAFNEVMAEEAKKKDGPEVIDAFAYGPNGKKIKLKMNLATNQIVEGGDAKSTDSSAAISD